VAGGQRTHELGVGIFARTPEQVSADGAAGGKRAHELGVGIFARTPEQVSADRAAGGQRTHELGVGMFARTPEQVSADGAAGGRVSMYSRPNPLNCTKCDVAGGKKHVESGHIKKFQAAAHKKVDEVCVLCSALLFLLLTFPFHFDA
jgi:hypothetical protein